MVPTSFEPRTSRKGRSHLTTLPPSHPPQKWIFEVGQRNLMRLKSELFNINNYETT